jgi:hypothetical protein
VPRRFLLRLAALRSTPSVLGVIWAAPPNTLRQSHGTGNKRPLLEGT